MVERQARRGDGLRDRPPGRGQMALRDGDARRARGRLPRRVPRDRPERADRLHRGLRGPARRGVRRRRWDGEHGDVHRSGRAHHRHDPRAGPEQGDPGRDRRLRDGGGHAGRDGPAGGGRGLASSRVRGTTTQAPVFGHECGRRHRLPSRRPSRFSRHVEPRRRARERRLARRAPIAARHLQEHPHLLVVPRQAPLPARERRGRPRPCAPRARWARHRLPAVAAGAVVRRLPRQLPGLARSPVGLHLRLRRDVGSRAALDRDRRPPAHRHASGGRVDRRRGSGRGPLSTPRGRPVARPRRRRPPRRRARPLPVGEDRFERGDDPRRRAASRPAAAARRPVGARARRRRRDAGRAAGAQRQPRRTPDRARGGDGGPARLRNVGRPSGIVGRGRVAGRARRRGEEPRTGRAAAGRSLRRPGRRRGRARAARQGLRPGRLRHAAAREALADGVVPGLRPATAVEPAPGGRARGAHHTLRASGGRPDLASRDRRRVVVGRCADRASGRFAPGLGARAGTNRRRAARAGVEGDRTARRRPHRAYADRRALARRRRGRRRERRRLRPRHDDTRRRRAPHRPRPAARHDRRARRTAAGDRRGDRGDRSRERRRAAALPPVGRVRSLAQPVARRRPDRDGRAAPSDRRGRRRRAAPTRQAATRHLVDGDPDRAARTGGDHDLRRRRADWTSTSSPPTSRAHPGAGSQPPSSPPSCRG